MNNEAPVMIKELGSNHCYVRLNKECKYAIYGRVLCWKCIIMEAMWYKLIFL